MSQNPSDQHQGARQPDPSRNPPDGFPFDPTQDPPGENPTENPGVNPAERPEMDPQERPDGDPALEDPQRHPGRGGH